MSFIQESQKNTTGSAVGNVKSNHSIFAELLKVLVYVPLLCEIPMTEENGMQNIGLLVTLADSSPF